MPRRLTRRPRFNLFTLPGVLFTTNPGDGGGGAPPGGAPPAGDAPPKDAPVGTFTQADIDRVVNERLTREKAKYAGFDDFKAKASKFDAAEAAKAPELERVAATARDEGKAEARAEGNRERVMDKIEVAAAGKFTDVEDARLRLGQKAEEFIGKDGAIDTTAIAAAVDALLKDKPHLAVNTKPQVAPPGRVGIGVGSGSDAPTVQPGLDRMRNAYAQSPNNPK